MRAMHTISIHEAGRWPFTGAADDRGGGRSRNFPVPSGFNDTELQFLMQHAVLPYAAAAATAGGGRSPAAPTRSREIRSRGLMLSNGALWGAVEALVELAPVAVVLGGGGYNPWTVARCWTGLWAKLSGRDDSGDAAAGGAANPRGVIVRPD